jgi:hypothetical protein
LARQWLRQEAEVKRGFWQGVGQGCLTVLAFLLLISVPVIVLGILASVIHR